MTIRTFTLTSIGTIHVGPGGMTIEVDPAYRKALLGLEGFTYVNVLWWCDGLDSDEYRSLTTVSRPYKKAPDMLGIFATRSPLRPNPIAFTPVPVLDIDLEAGVITIAYIDANDGSPLLDIKPYTPAIDRVREVSTPEWCATWPQFQEESGSFDWGSVFENAS